MGNPAAEAGAGQGARLGGATLPLALAEAGLIDEYEFIVHPRIAGHGPTPCLLDCSSSLTLSPSTGVELRVRRGGDAV